MLPILPAVIPVSLIIVIGFIAGRTLPLDNQTVSKITLYILSPALVFDSLYRTTLSLQNTQDLLVAFALTSCLTYLLVWVISKIGKLTPSLQKGLIATAIFSNNGNIGLPIANFAFGAAGLERAVIYMIGSSILMFCFGPAILKGKGIHYSIRLILKLPLFWSIVAAVGLHLLSFKFPFQIDLAIQELGQAAIPVALILLGMQLSHTQFELRIQEVLAAFLRLLVAPLIAYFIGLNLHLESLSLQILVLQSAMPTAVNSLVLVTEFGGDANFVARSIVTSTVMSFVTLPLILWLF
jgi:predicted permease